MIRYLDHWGTATLTGLKKYLIYDTPIKTKNQEKHDQELGKEVIVPSCENIIKKIIAFFYALYENAMCLEHSETSYTIDPCHNEATPPPTSEANNTSNIVASR
ncbi:hypothetical protein TNCV_931751 [Trichonephila clavipes]|uniref:Uncharacterized protein n=1 Tax=Trichonephila clavipes TaxID=2585209 RepID=A0A8X7BDW0_TRICX|nr:hypothetical protein TNCV_931751 [Trichonephila clavipes]